MSVCLCVCEVKRVRDRERGKEGWENGHEDGGHYFVEAHLILVIGDLISTCTVICSLEFELRADVS